MNRRALSKAVSDNDSPVPGYLYNEIASMLLSQCFFFFLNVTPTRISPPRRTETTTQSPRIAEKIVIYLKNRLKGKTSAYVKWKVLNIIKHVVMKGSSEFKLECQKMLASDVKALLHFKGKSDPIKGDQPNKQVRVSAKAALAAIFSAKKSNRQNVGRSSKMVGISSDSFNKPVVRSESAPRGGGEKIFGEAPKGWSFKSNRGKNNVHSNRPDYDAPVESRRSPRVGKDPRSPKASSRRRGGVGGNWGNAQVELKVGGGLRRKKESLSFASSTSSQRESAQSRLASLEVGKAVTDGTFERQLVDNLVGAGGIRADIPKSKISEFTLRCRTLRADVVVPILLERLESKKWQRRARSIVVINALVKDRGCASYKTFVRDMDSSWLADRFESETNKRVRLVMHDALLSLYPDEYEEESDENDVADDDDDDDDDDVLGLMDDGDGDDKKKKTSSDEMSDLFGDMSVRGGGEENEEENGGGFSFIDADEGDQEEEEEEEESGNSGFDFVGTSNNEDDMFNGMNVKNDDDGNQMDDLFGDTSGMQSSTVAPTSTSVPGMSVFDQFSGTSTSMSSPTSLSFMPPPPRSMMGIPSPSTMSRKTIPPTSTTTTTTTTTSSSLSSSTGFGFMNKKEEKKDAFDFVGDLLN